MLIAEQLEKHGAVAGTSFRQAITDLIITLGLQNIIETGTLYGTGTTAAVLDGLEALGTDGKFISIECNPHNFLKARANTKGRPVRLLKGLSIPKELRPKLSEIDFSDYPDDTIVDHQPEKRAKNYFDETNYPGTDCLLDVALRMMSYQPDLVILDSGGHIGTIEFNYLMSKVKGEFYLALDDTRHVKHRKTVEQIKADCRFTDYFSTDEKFGSGIYKVQVH